MLIREIPRIKDAKITVMGLGFFGGGGRVTRYLVKNGAKVTVTDLKPEKELKETIDSLSGLPITFHINGHTEKDFTDADLIIVNPAVPPDSPFLSIAQKNNIPLETELNLFFKMCKAKIIGVTGSNGKTTTTTLIGEVLKKSPKKVWVGGNIGKSLLEEVDEIQQNDLVVLEISSFQLENLAVLNKSPHISVLLNITPNHLDRHKTMENYINAKKNIIKYQGKNDWAILNWDDPTVREFANSIKSKTKFFSIKEPVSNGAFCLNEKICLTDKNIKIEIDVSNRKIPGWFNLQNMVAATGAIYTAIGNEWKLWKNACEEVFNTFKGVEHRLELVCERNGVKFYNDSIATNPESTIAALDTISPPIILIAGGYDKNLPFDELAKKIPEKVHCLILMGQTADKIEELVKKEKDNIKLYKAQSLDEAVRVAKKEAVSGDTVLLSPACASYDMFRNFAERGKLFKKLVT